MASEEQLTLKKIEISINNFNSLAVPHYIDLLAKHKNNVEKFRIEGTFNKAKNEHVNATRVIVQVKQLLEEMDALRRQLNSQDMIKFDNLTENSKKKTSRAIVEYFESYHRFNKASVNFSNENYSFGSGNFEESLDSNDKSNYPHLQTQIVSLQTSQDELNESEFLLRELERAEEKAQGIHELIAKLDEIVKVQADPINVVEKNCESSAVAIDEGRRLLYRAENLNAKWYPVAGAAIGSLIAGPVGLLMGIKIGVVALMGGSVMGFTGGKMIKNNKKSNCPQTDSINP